ncbi:uncharacterized protein RCO7_01911 [Rhynchosporium graminicola]|uniref:Xylanolytic transcriptional activator regulatory domain-containing protein n=1 Tax=Rhynchosporium graminicola TaxID=2792576 RepID=A0A1E1KU93_9HELO|nr:uncharacterized protein RCO7_01911 [Rhynchosporium commune]
MQSPPARRKKESPSQDIKLTKAVSWIETDAFEHTASSMNDLSALDAKITESFGSFVFSVTRPIMAPTFDHNLAVLLPTRAQGEILLDYYLDNVNWIYHVIHVPTVKVRFDAVYNSIEMSQSPNHSHLALISTIFALSAYFSTATSRMYFKHSEAMFHSRRWTILAQEALSASNCLAEPNIETLQSLILISQHMMANIGAIATIRTLSATIIYAARTMSLHTIDAARTKKLRENTVVDYVDLELKRRLWWHIVSTDYANIPIIAGLLSFMSGAQCGTYMIHPKQMHVDYPSNVCDQNISSLGPDAYAQPIEIPTEMTYSLFRFRFSTIYREMVDEAWDIGSDMDDLPYEIVLEFDKKMNNVAFDLENSYAALGKLTLNFMQPEKAGIHYQVSDPKKISLVRQRDMMYFGLHTRYARLHRPYLVRGAQDSRYSYSRMVCLRSARTVIELGKSMIGSNKALTSFKIWFVNHHVFVSAMILVMDYCFNREEPRAKERREEILDCFIVLEGSREESTMASRGLTKLKSMLSEKSGDTKRGAFTGNTAAQYHQTSAASDIGQRYTTTLSPTAVLSRPPSTTESVQYSNTEQDFAHYPGDTVMSVKDFNDNFNSGPPAPACQDSWPAYDYFSIDNINFDIDLDVSQLEALFQGIDGTAYS